MRNDPKALLRLFAAITISIAGTTLSLQAQELQVIQGQPSYLMRSPQVELAVTQLGGQMAPVTFYRDTPRPVQPYYISPWQQEATQPMPAPVLVPLRGDLFCLPFGGNAEVVQGEAHPPHGETAGSPWTFQGLEHRGPVTTLTMTIQPRVRPGRITKRLSLVEGQNVVYSQHVIEGFAGRAPLGHHATLAMPDAEGTVRLATSPLLLGMTNPGMFSNPRAREYQSLLPGQRWTALSQVPLAWKDQPDADLTFLPARFGHADLVQVINDTDKTAGDPAWTTALFSHEGYLWFAFKDPAVLNSTVFWIENHGRHGHPWNGRNHCLGIEDVTAFFAEGLAASTRENLWTTEGVTTSVPLSNERPSVINYIQGVVRLPEGFDGVQDLHFDAQQVTFIAGNGQKVSAPVHIPFLQTGNLP